MLKRVLLLIIATLAFVLFPLLTESIAQQVANPKHASYKGVANFYSQRFFPVGQVAPANSQQVQANVAADEQTTNDGSTLDNLPKVGDTKIIKDANGQDVEMVLKNITQDGNQVNMEWEPVSGEGGGIGEVINIDGPGFIQDNAGTDQTTDATDTNAADTTQDTTQANAQAIEATYDANAGTITYTANGEEKTINIADIGLSAEWMETLTGLGGTLSVTENEDGSAKLITGSDEGGAKKWEFDPSARLVSHYTGEAGSEKASVVTTDQKYNSNYLWTSDGTADPQAGPDGHFVAQRFNYKESGDLNTVDYFAWTGGNRGGLHPADHKAVFGVDLTKARYMYRQDTVYKTGSEDNGEVTANCEEGDNTKIVTKYYNDTFPEDWDPVYTGTVTKDEYGSYWLDTGSKKFLLVCATDGFDADSDGKSGADEMNSVNWENLVGKEITVRGNEIASDSEAGIYYDGEKAEMFEVVDLITPEEKESLGDNYQATYDNMVAVASRVDPVHEGLIGSGEGPGKLGVLNLFNGAIPTAGQLVEGQQLPRRMNSIASVYVNNITADDLAAIREFAIPELATALDAAEQAREQAAAADTTTTGGTQAAAASTTNTAIVQGTQAADSQPELFKKRKATGEAI